MGFDIIWLIRSLIFLIAGLISLLFTRGVCAWQKRTVARMQKIPILKFVSSYLLPADDARIMRADRRAGVIFLIISAGILVFLVFD